MDSTPSTPGAESSSVPPTPADETKTAPDSPAERPADDEGLPELEPLTPELVEDEAIRGDFMLRWAAVLLAVLFGWTEISESLTLVRIKTGEYLASHGWLPPRTDVFSVSAGDRPWLNFSWLGDLVLAGVHGLGGGAALTVMAALLAGVSVWCMLAASRTGVSTWWGSICAVLAALAVFPLLRPGPDSITILGLAATMLLLMKAEEHPDRARYVLLAPLLWLWSNLDGHAFLGAAVVIAYAVGDLVDSRRKPIETQGKMWKFAIVGVVAMLLHPLHIGVAQAPRLLYGVEAREQLKYGGEESEFGFLWKGAIDRDVWQNLNVFTLAAVLTAVAAGLSLGLNRRHLRMSHVLTWLALCGLALVSVRALTAGSIVWAVLASVNGQEWYRRGFRQSYSVDTSELLFSRGGRAVTVVGLFALAYLAASGRLMGADGRRIGMGFNAEIATSIASLQDVLADSYDDRAFNFNLNQGDLLIWVGQKPFIDSRLGLYAGSQPNLAERHRELRLALTQRLQNDDRTGQRNVWHAAFEEFEISHVLPRLSGRVPNYSTLFDLLTDPEREWQLVKLGAAGATLYWHRPGDAELAEYLAVHTGADFLRQAFPREEPGDDPAPLPPLASPRSPSWYDRMLILPRQTFDNDVQMARHYMQLRAALSGRVAQDYAAALTILAIRHARRGLMKDPNSPEAYHTLSSAYLAMMDLERLLQGGEQGAATQIRFRQALTSVYHAVRCDPDDAVAHMTLYQLMVRNGMPDLAVQHLRDVERITGRLTLLSPDSEEGREDEARNREALDQLTTQINEIRKQLQESLNSDTSRPEVVSAALTRGLPGEALRLLEEDQTVIAQNVSVQMLYAELLMDAGRIEDALNQLEQLSSLMQRQSPSVASSWRFATASTNIAAGNYERARTLLEDDADQATMMRLQSVLGSSPQPGALPGISTVPFTHAPREMSELRGLSRVTLMADLLGIYPSQWGRDEFVVAMCDVEDGRNQAAADRLNLMLEQDPESAIRPTLAFYASMITGDPVTFLPPSQEIPVWGGMFADDSEEGPPPPGAALPDAGTGEAALPPAPPSSERRASGETP